MIVEGSEKYLGVKGGFGINSFLLKGRKYFMILVSDMFILFYVI